VFSEEKAVFLIGEEIEQYPIDFKARFGIDYAQYTPRSVRLREITRLIWHSQLSTHNGGDFFNEVFDGHPNLVAVTSMMLEGIPEAMDLVHHAAVMHVPSYEQLLAALTVQGFKYIKTFTPMRHITTSYGASAKFMYKTVGLRDQVCVDFKSMPMLRLDEALPERPLYH